MGMFTQVRGWLNVESIGCDENYITIMKIVNKAKEDFLTQETWNEVELPERRWVCENTFVHQGGNGSVFIFFGAELENYERQAQCWIECLIERLPSAEGRIDFQFEEDYEQCEYWLIRDGEVIKRDYNKTWCKGYGNTWKK